MPVVTTNAIVSTNIAATQARKIKTENCKLVLDTYKSGTQQTSAEEMQVYAECVQYLYPQSNENMKVFVGGMLLSMVVAVLFTYYLKWRNKQRWDVEDHCTNVFLAMVGGPALLLGFLILVEAVLFVFS